MTRALPLLFALVVSCAAPVDRLVPPILERDRIPGAVIVAGDAGGVTHRRAYGDAALDTIFDLASLTKVIATTTAAMRLVEEGRLSLDDPVGKHLPPFAGRAVAVRDLLRHRSGLPAYLTPKVADPDLILEEIAGLPVKTGMRYSCLNMILLARIVENVSGMPLQEFAAKTIFEPLGMKDTTFAPDPSRCAATVPGRAPGRVHDPLAHAYRTAAHQAGNAGLFSTADDLAVFCGALLGGRVLRPETVRAMFEPDGGTRGLGWDVFDDPPYAPGVGHTGYTGTLIWMDPARGRFVVLLTNRVLSGEKTDVRALRREVLSALR